MAVTVKKQEMQEGTPLQQAARAAWKRTTPTANAGQITQSYYTGKTNKSNYEQGQPNYVQSDAVKKAAEDLANAEQQKPGPFQSNYGDKIQGLLDTILNRGKFTYDFNADPIYQQYAQRYQEQGQQAMKDTMAQAAALTGGYGSTYGQSVGQQTYQQYLQQLNDKIPELRQAAYQQYQDEGQNLRDNLGMLQGQDDRDYNRYRNDVSDYQTELSYFYNKFSDMSEQEYQRYQNDLAAWQKDRDYWYNKWLAEEELALKKGSGGGGGRGRRRGSEEEEGDGGGSYFAPQRFLEQYMAGAQILNPDAIKANAAAAGRADAAKKKSQSPADKLKASAGYRLEETAKKYLKRGK